MPSSKDKRISKTKYSVAVERVSTGSEPIDKLLKGGVEKGIITNIFGESGTGKTNVCIQAAAHIAKNGGKVIYIDTEKGLSTERFTQIADEDALKNLHLLEPMTFEEQEQKINALPELLTDDTELVIVDSMVSLYRLQANGDNVSEINQRLSKQFSQLSKAARKHNLAVMVTNQVYTSFDEDSLELVGRDVPRYWSKCLLKLSYEDQNLRKMEIEKHRSMPEGKACRFKIANEGLLSTERKPGF